MTGCSTEKVKGDKIFSWEIGTISLKRTASSVTEYLLLQYIPSRKEAQSR